MDKVLMGFLLMISSQCYCQIGKLWYFGDGAGIDFTGNSPQAVYDNALFCLDQSAVCTDAAGQLLFYSNGVEIYNRNHQLMTNGDDIGVSYDGGQCALIVPQLYSSRFYVFTVGNWNNSHGFRYSVVDMALQGGLGEVVEKDVLLFGPSTERIAAVYSPEATCYWVVTHKWNSDKFMAYKVDQNGIDLAPVESSIGFVHSGGSPSGYNAVGQMTFSPDGEHLVCAIYSAGYYEYFDFDPLTGSLSNFRRISGYSKAWGTAFSPDGTKLYTTKWFGADVYQFDLSMTDWSQMQDSVHTVGSVSVPLQYKAGFLELGPDHRIYVAKFQQDNLAVINYPDSLGSACGFADYAFDLSPATCNAGLCRSATIGKWSITEIPEPAPSCLDNLGHIRQVMTPDGDGQNDFLLPTLSDMDCRLQLKVFDSRGALVYSGEGNWGGYDNRGSLLSMGVYHYLIASERASRAGHVLLMPNGNGL